MRSAISRAGQPSKTRSAADRLCHGVAGVHPAKAVTEPDRRRSLDSRPNSRLSRVSDSSATSSHPPERDISRNDRALNDSKVDMPNSAPVPSRASPSRTSSSEVAPAQARPAPTVWVGLDVAKATLDLHVRPSGWACPLANDAKGHRAILKKLPQAGECLIVLEATGGYERPLVAELLEVGHHVAVMNPNRMF